VKYSKTLLTSARQQEGISDIDTNIHVYTASSSSMGFGWVSKNTSSRKTAQCTVLHWAMDLTRKPYNVEIK